MKTVRGLIPMAPLLQELESGSTSCWTTFTHPYVLSFDTTGAAT